VSEAEDEKHDPYRQDPERLKCPLSPVLKYEQDRQEEEEVDWDYDDE